MHCGDQRQLCRFSGRAQTPIVRPQHGITPHRSDRGRVDLPRLRGHPAKHESAVGVDDGETRAGQAADVFG